MFHVVIFLMGRRDFFFFCNVDPEVNPGFLVGICHRSRGLGGGGVGEGVLEEIFLM